MLKDMTCMYCICVYFIHAPVLIVVITLTRSHVRPRRGIIKGLQILAWNSEDLTSDDLEYIEVVLSDK